MVELIVKLVLANMVLALMLSIGLAVRPRELAQVVHHPRLYLRALLVMEIGVPLLAMVVVSGLALSPLATGLILLMAICPGAPFIPLVSKTKGEVYSTVGLNLLLLASVLAPLSIPAWVAILDRLYPFELQITPVQVAARVVPVVILPIVAGIAIRALSPRVADVLARVVHYIFIVTFVIAIAIGLVLGAPVFLELSVRTLLAVVLVVSGTAVMGAWAARTQPGARRAVVFSTVLGNPGIALAIVAASYPDLRAGAFIIAYLVLRRLALVPFELWIKRRATPAAHPPLDRAQAVGT